MILKPSSNTWPVFKSIKDIKTPPSDWPTDDTVREMNQVTEKDLYSRSAPSKSQDQRASNQSDSFKTEQKKWLEEKASYENELRKKDAHLNQTKTYLDIVERDRATCKQELQAYNFQTIIWKEEMERKQREAEEMQKKMDFLFIENERLKRLSYENEDLRRKLDLSEAEKRRAIEERDRAIAQLRDAEHALSKRNGVQKPSLVKSSFPQLLCHDPSSSHAPANGRIIPERFPPSEPEIRWHPKEDDKVVSSSTAPSSPPARSLAPDQYGPLQAWLRKQNMKAAFSGAYAVTSSSSGSNSQRVSSRENSKAKVTRDLVCPRCDSRFDARNFSAYRCHLEDCL